MKAGLRQTVASEMPNAICARKGYDCQGRLTVEHPFGRKIQERWMFIYLCYFHHLGLGFNKEINKLLCYNQATKDDLVQTFPKTWQQHLKEKEYLAKKYAQRT